MAFADWQPIDTAPILLERLARIIDPEVWADWDAVRPLALPYPYSGQERLDSSLAKARSVIDALREPTDEMVDAGQAALSGDPFPLSAWSMWTAMLNSAVPQ